MRYNTTATRFRPVRWTAIFLTLFVASTGIGFGEDSAEQLASRNLPPTFRNTIKGSIEFDVVFPSAYDWKEQERIVTCIRRIHADLDDPAVFSSVMEHLFDPRYCVSIWRLRIRENLSVGEVCCEILTSRAEEFIQIPSKYKTPMEAFPFQLGHRRDLSEWRQLHKTASLMDVQLESISDSKALFEKLAQQLGESNKPVPELVQDYLKHLERLRQQIKEQSRAIPVRPKQAGVVTLSAATGFQFESEFLLESAFKTEGAISKQIDSTFATDGIFGAAVYVKMPQSEPKQANILKSIKGRALDFTDAETARLWMFDSKTTLDDNSRPLRLMIAEQARKLGYSCIRFVASGDETATVALIVSPGGR